ncbi:MAG: hypothetical protein PT934_00055 [Peptoniphilaceae bacterium]|uniref:hypothetical protein n=1 Tax=Parvimonas sp. TaxID=1944660 RepID=UPI0025F178E8|nr:hypothetical protein [Parvimonas sp.]MCI5997056.1 hypothetical protein [Parvimonas sp.]MDD7764142.1 hypothetical protein [Peptoniphilaceae bacterium]MDY3050743.1 hypothetical protein [Parvimonas sp.]
MEKKYLKVNFDLSNSKKRSISVKNIQSECTDENLRALSALVEKFIDGTKTNSVKVVESTL